MVTLTNVGSAYDSIAAARGLGIMLVDFTGITDVRLDVYANKVGSGTQSWQLWNETDSAEILVINDAGASGNKFLTGSAAVALTGVKRVRVRAKSTVSTDDPVFYGAAVLLTRP